MACNRLGSRNVQDATAPRPLHVLQVPTLWCCGAHWFRVGLARVEYA